LASLRLLSVVNRLSRLRLGPGCIPILVEDAGRLRWRHRNSFCGRCSQRTGGALVVDIRAMDRIAATTCASDAAAATRRARVAAAEDWAPGPTVGRRAIAIAVQASQQTLAGTETAIALLSSKLAVALIARIAAIGRITDPFVDIDLAAAAAATPTVSDPRKQAALTEGTAAAAAVVGARLTWAIAALVCAAIPNDRLGQAQTGKTEAAGGAAAGATIHTAAATAK